MRVSLGRGDPAGALKAGALWTGCPKGGCEYSWGMGTPAHRAICGPSAPCGCPTFAQAVPPPFPLSIHPTPRMHRYAKSVAKLS